jgi:glycerol-3-phosphate dehydrogenase subunit C
VLGHPDAVGKLGTAMSPLANWANESGLHRQFMQSLLGIHKDKKLPPFASKTFASQFAAHRKTPQGEPAAKIAFFSTCYVNFAHLVEQFLG